MKKNAIRVLVIVLLFIICILNPINTLDIQANEYVDDKKNVLFISSYAPNFITFNEQIAGIKDALGENFELQIEYMDVKKFSGEKNEEVFYNLLKFKIQNYKKFDAVILGDDAALSFGLKHRDGLLKNIPMVFLGASNELNIREAKSKNVEGGVLEYASIEETVDFIAKNNLYKKNLVLITGKDNEYKFEIEKFYEMKDKYPNLKFSHINVTSNITYNFIKMLNDLNNEDTVVLLITPYKDTYGENMGVIDIVDLITENIDIPIYTTLYYGIDDKIIGGKVIDHYEQGKQAGKLVYDILDEKYTNSKYIEPDKSNIWMFDYNSLREHGIRTDVLPEGALIINEPEPFLEKYSDAIIPSIFVLTSLLIIIYVLVMNVIRRSKHEKELSRAKKLAEDANVTKNNFISNISHELRTPVAVIMSSTQLLRRLSNSNATNNMEIIDKNLDIINQNSNRLLRLVNNIIDVAKIDSGFNDLRLENTDIVSLIEDTVLSIIPYSESKNLEVIFDTNVEELVIAVDKEKIERVILNLLSNAIKFSKNGGKIFANILYDKDTLAIEIEDTGIGIDTINLYKIFDKFVQIDNGFTRQNEGSGIGLAIVKSFVNLHDGKIDVTSKLDKGTKFTITLPIKVLKEDSENTNEIHAKDMNVNVELSDIFIDRDDN